ncbi:zinc finger protein 143 isoform X4 [Tachyglossus aculeatus]|uniref:zinc finger protein 143 isoform X4 n=1 Tax=Tachyglossus aculeatus TaxID=9261 RepID=UPI0018F73D72|nr:zinc finger protein 143 isoform X4 [Tachyglossus aculeatus]
MLLAQINRDSQGMTEFPGGGMEAQHVTLCLTEAVAVADGDNLENMEGVSLQAVTLADGSTAYIQHNSKDGKLMDGQVIQLEDGSAAYVQHVPMPKSTGDSLRLEDGQAVQLEDGTTAFIHHTSKDSYDQSALQAVQLEDGTTAYIHHTVQVPQSDTILAIQADGTVAGLHTGDGTIDPDTISALEQYAAKVSIDGSESVGTGMMGENEQEKKMQIVLQGHGTRVPAKSQQTGEKAFRCDYDGCGKLYTTAHHLKVHERSHTGDRPYQCEHPGCGKAFATGYGLKSHVRTHTGEKPYRCSEDNCTKSFKTSGDLQKHIRTHTGERPFKCPYEGCGRSFTTSNIRKVHIRTHTGERPYYCTEPGCGRAFASATNYKNHVRIHTGCHSGSGFSSIPYSFIRNGPSAPRTSFSDDRNQTCYVISNVQWHSNCCAAWRTAVIGRSHQNSLQDTAGGNARTGRLTGQNRSALLSSESRGPCQYLKTLKFPFAGTQYTFLCKSGEHFTLDAFVYITFGIDFQPDPLSIPEYKIRVVQ